MNKRITTNWLGPTKNFRASSRRLLGYYGGNVQNASESLMRCIIPDDNHIFIQGDQDGAEARVVAYECRRARFRKLFELGIKPHSYTALQLYLDKFKTIYDRSRYDKVEPEVLLTYPEYKELFKTIKSADSGRPYAVGKMVRHAKNYKMGPRTAQVNSLERSEGEINLTYAQWQTFLQVDDEVFPEIVELQNSIKEQLLQTRTLYNLFGFPREFTGIWSEGLVRDGCAYCPQSTVGCITHMAFVATHHKIKKERLPWKLLNNKHDSLLISVKDIPEHIEAGIAWLKSPDGLGKKLTSSRGEEYVMGVGISVGHNWGKYDEKNNPNGMKEI